MNCHFCSNKAYSRNFLINSKVSLWNIVYDTSVDFYCTYLFLDTVGYVMLHSQKHKTLICMANVFCYICTTICVGLCHNSHRCCLCPVTHKFTCVCHFSKQSTIHRLMSHFLQKYSVLCVCFFSEHMRHCLCFPLEGQCFECFTSNRLSWDANGLGLPLEMPLAVTFSSRDWIFSSPTRASQKFLWVILLSHNL
jgi:hypothetical protein